MRELSHKDLELMTVQLEMLQRESFAVGPRMTTSVGVLRGESGSDLVGEESRETEANGTSKSRTAEEESKVAHWGVSDLAHQCPIPLDIGLGLV